jgi:hypothetical protein
MAIPTTITATMRKQLFALGYSKTLIKGMTPARAHEILMAQRAWTPPTDSEPRRARDPRASHQSTDAPPGVDRPFTQEDYDRERAQDRAEAQARADAVPDEDRAPLSAPPEAVSEVSLRCRNCGRGLTTDRLSIDFTVREHWIAMQTSAVEKDPVRHPFPIPRPYIPKAFQIVLPVVDLLDGLVGTTPDSWQDGNTYVAAVVDEDPAPLHRIIAVGHSEGDTLWLDRIVQVPTEKSSEAFAMLESFRVQKLIGGVPLGQYPMLALPPEPEILFMTRLTARRVRIYNHPQLLAEIAAKIKNGVLQDGPGGPYWQALVALIAGMRVSGFSAVLVNRNYLSPAVEWGLHHTMRDPFHTPLR